MADTMDYIFAPARHHVAAYLTPAAMTIWRSERIKNMLCRRQTIRIEVACMDKAKQRLDDLRRQVGRICEGKGDFHDFTQLKDFRAFTPAPADSRLQPAQRVTIPADRMTFGRWLLQQNDRGDWIDDLAAAARTDPRFPKEGDPDQVRKRLTEMAAEGNMFEALDDAELDWLSL